MFSYHPLYFDFHSARVIFDVSSGFYFWDVNRTPKMSKMFKVAFKDVSTKNSEPTYWTILFVMLKIYFIYKVAGKKSRRALSNWTMSSASQTPPLPVMGSLIVLVNKRADWNVPVSYIKYMSPCSACGFSTKKPIKSKHNFESRHFQTFCYFT
jgi:Na+-translocating ferredoxin:NAD+ oxidoreductase RnfD subunit